MALSQPYNTSFPSSTAIPIKEERLENYERQNDGNLPQVMCSPSDSMTAASHKFEPGRTQMDYSLIRHIVTADASVLGSSEDSMALRQLYNSSSPSSTAIPIKEEPLENGVIVNDGNLPQAACLPGDSMTGGSHKFEPGLNMPVALLCANFTKSICKKRELNFPEQAQRELVPSIKAEEEKENLADNNMVHHTIGDAETSQSSMCSVNSESPLDPNAAVSDASSLPRTMELPEEFFMSDNEVELLNSDEALQEMMHDLHTCPICNRRFRYPSRLRKHMIIHNAERKFKCDKCGATFKDKYSLKTHLFTHSLDKPFNCDVCSSCHCTKSALTAHIERKHGTGARRFICDICGLMFLTRCNLDKHIILHRDKNVLCVTCGRLFYTELRLRKHVTTYHNPSSTKTEKKFECSHCGRMFSCKFALKVHILTVHLKEMPFECMICGLKFAVKKTLEQHMMCHTERKFKCNCGKSFSNKAGFERHSLIHINYRPYMCDMCGLTFTQKSSVERHIVVNMMGHFKRTGTCKPITGGRGGYYLSSR